MELDPLYCDAIVSRWEQFTGQRAQRPGTPGTAGNGCGRKREGADGAGQEVQR